jgi:hypothetical protein
MDYFDVHVDIWLTTELSESLVEQLVEVDDIARDQRGFGRCRREQCQGRRRALLLKAGQATAAKCSQG